MNSKVQQKYQEAQELYRQERWAEALVVLDDLALSYKSDQEIMLNRAMCLARIGKEEEAELLCDHLTVVHKDPRAAQLKAQIPQSKRDGKLAPTEKKSRKSPINKQRIKQGVILLALCAVGVGAWTFYSNFKLPPSTPIATAPAPAGRTLSFPSEESLGILSVRDWGYETNTQGNGNGVWTPLGEAKGRVEVPEGKEVRLVFRPSQVAYISSLKRLGKNDVQSLILNDCAIGDEEMGYVSHMTGLFDFSIDGTQVGPPGYEKLYRLTSLRIASLIGTTLGEPGRAFISNQPYLESIDADRADLGDSWLIGLPPMDHLIFLSLDEIEDITDEGIQHIAKHRNLKKLFLSYTKLTDKGLKAIQTLKHIDRLWLEATQITDAGMAGFRTMPNIAELGVAYTSVSNDGLMELNGIRTLTKVGLRGCQNITEAGARQFKVQNPKVFVETAYNL